MNRKINSLFSHGVMMVIALVMLLGFAIPALAISTGSNATDPAKAAITKIFMVPVNTTTPQATFTFTFAKAGVDDGTDITGMPDLGTGGSVTVTFDLDQKETFISNGTKYLVAQSTDILGNLPKDGSAWQAGAGIYKYTVTESDSGIVFSANPYDTEYTSYSEASYDIEIWVEEDEDGILFARYIVGFYKAGTPDEYYPETPGEGKLDPTPGTTVPGTPDEIGINYSSIIFTNKYWKTDGPVDPGTDPEINALEIVKKVAGLNPNQDTYFDFSVTVVTPKVVGNDSKTYNAYIVNEAGAYVLLGVADNPNTKSGTDVNGRDYITLTSDTAKTVALKHGERLVFFDLEVGAEVRVFETITSGTRVKYSRTFSTNAGNEFNMPAGAVGTWGFPRNPGDAGPHFTKEGVRGNIVTFINTMGATPPTGISVNDLPYIILIILAAAALVGYAAVKSRKKIKSDD